ncbi:MAG: glycosyltransferase [Rhodospirillaceae bacterium]|nr:glycosyltransferase [Rhodospirillaceae bacterium]
MADIPGISVVMPSFEQGRFIDAALRSLLDQGYPALEIIVVDGGSSDDTVERLRRYGDRIAWTSTPDRGQADALEKGFARATQPWLTWLNSDDVHAGRALWAIAEAATAAPEADVIYGRGHFIDEAGGFAAAYPTVVPALGQSMAEAMFASGYVAQPSVYFRDRAYRQVGGIDASLHFVMDYELWVRFARAGLRFVHVDADISGNRQHGAAKTTARLAELYAEAIQVQRRHYGRVSPYFAQAVSDHLYRARRDGRDSGPRALLWRWLYFKTVWARLNANQPGYCLRGLVGEAMAEGGPVIGDKVGLGTILRRCLARGNGNG